MLENLLKNKNCIKIVTGAGNQNLEQVEKLVAIYAQAGCRFFDICADIDVLKAAKNAVKKTGKNPKDFAFCISIGVNGDPHIQKAKINKDTCIECLKCISRCPQDAICQNLSVLEKNCIGCHNCFSICSTGSISFYNKQKDLSEILPELIKEGVDCIELHANSFDEDEVFKKWEYLNKNFKGFLSICLDRKSLSTQDFCKRVEKALSYRKPYTTIIQADGNPMSGTKNDYQTTLEAIATAKIIADKKYPAYLLISGGTNAKTKELARMFEIDTSGIAYGSYARELIKNKDIDMAVNKAKVLLNQ